MIYSVTTTKHGSNQRKKNTPKIQTMLIQGFKTQSSLTIGNIDRYVVKYKLHDGNINHISEYLNASSVLKIKIHNLVHISLRAAGLVTGPYTLYCEVRPQNYHHHQRVFATANQPKFESNVQPQQTFHADLQLNDFSKEELTWTIDVISQVLLTCTATITYELSIEFENGAGMSSDRLYVTKMNTEDIWELPFSQLQNNPLGKKDHLVVLTHGLLSNLTTDMLYLKEEIEKSDPCCIVTGYSGNVCKTEKGIKYLGIKLANFIVSKTAQVQSHIKKISFIGHSLGGLVQTFAIAYIGLKFPLFFQKLQLENFITLASPLTGVLTDNPKYVQLLLAAGMLGKSGVDLGLASMDGYANECLLSLLPCAHTRNLLRRFKRRTVYANAINDGVVPLYSSCLLYLDYEDVMNSLEEYNNPEVSVQELKGEQQEFLQKNLVKPFSKAVSLWAPQATTTSEPRSIPKLSLLDTASHVLLQPVPPLAFIVNPSARPNIILHDRLYTAADIETIKTQESFQALLTKSKKSKKNLNYMLEVVSGGSDDARHKEEVIASRWHKDLTWRKVALGLEPDAHNNINVRRRFSNGYGWQVIDHLTTEHFIHPYTETATSNNFESTDDVSDFNWLLEPEKQGFFDAGATGLISSMSNLLDQWTGTTEEYDSTPTSHDGKKQKQSVYDQALTHEDLDLLGV